MHACVRECVIYMLSISLLVLQMCAREEILANGGSISHHHGGEFKMLSYIYIAVTLKLLPLSENKVKRLSFLNPNTVTKLNMIITSQESLFYSSIQAGNWESSWPNSRGLGELLANVWRTGGAPDPCLMDWGSSWPTSGGLRELLTHVWRTGGAPDSRLED